MRRGAFTAIGAAIAVVLVSLVVGVLVNRGQDHTKANRDTARAATARASGPRPHSVTASASAQQTWPVTGTVMSKSSILDQATTGGPASGDGSGRLTSVSAYAAQSTYQGAGAVVEATNPNVDSSTPVWIVTIHWSGPIVQPLGPPGAPAPLPTSVTTVVYDAISGNPIDACSGCSVVQSDGSLKSALAP